MGASYPTSNEFSTPESLGLDTRDRVRKDAIKLLDAMPEGEGHLVVDLSRTKIVDSAGLGALMLIHRHASERRQSVELVNSNDELRFLLALTKLDELFAPEAEEAAAD